MFHMQNDPERAASHAINFVLQEVSLAHERGRVHQESDSAPMRQEAAKSLELLESEPLAAKSAVKVPDHMVSQRKVNGIIEKALRELANKMAAIVLSTAE